jgi:large subunit ribosomal protein L22
MGYRKRTMAERLKGIKKQIAVAKLNNVPTSPRKMRLVADLVRGLEVNKALDILKYTKKEASGRLERLLKSAIANWEAKNEADRKELEAGNVFVQHISVGQGPTIKRFRPAPKGRASRIRKRSNHVTVVLGRKIEEEILTENEVVTEDQ